VASLGETFLLANRERYFKHLVYNLHNYPLTDDSDRVFMVYFLSYIKDLPETVVELIFAV
jgi:hypothetical protein